MISLIAERDSQVWDYCSVLTFKFHAKPPNDLKLEMSKKSEFSISLISIVQLLQNVKTYSVFTIHLPFIFQTNKMSGSLGSWVKSLFIYSFIHFYNDHFLVKAEMAN